MNDPISKAIDAVVNEIVGNSEWRPEGTTEHDLKKVVWDTIGQSIIQAAVEKLKETGTTVEQVETAGGSPSLKVPGRYKPQELGRMS